MWCSWEFSRIRWKSSSVRSDRQSLPVKSTPFIPFKSISLPYVASWQFYNGEESSVRFTSPKKKTQMCPGGAESPRTDGMGGINCPGDTESMVANCFMLGSNHECTLCDNIIYFRKKKVKPSQPCISHWPYFLNKKPVRIKKKTHSLTHFPLLWLQTVNLYYDSDIVRPYHRCEAHLKSLDVFLWDCLMDNAGASVIVQSITSNSTWCGTHYEIFEPRLNGASFSGVCWERESRASDHFHFPALFIFSQGKMEIGHGIWAHAILETGFPHNWNEYMMMLEMSNACHLLCLYISPSHFLLLSLASPVLSAG